MNTKLIIRQEQINFIRKHTEWAINEAISWGEYLNIPLNEEQIAQLREEGLALAESMINDEEYIDYSNSELKDCIEQSITCIGQDIRDKYKEKTIREIYDTDKIDLAFYRIGHEMNSFISLDDELYNEYLELYDKPLSYITCRKLNLINGMIHIIQGIMNISHVLHDRSVDYSDDILWEAKKELEKIAEDGLNQYK